MMERGFVRDMGQEMALLGGVLRIRDPERVTVVQTDWLQQRTV